jgi:hypothetical protein
MDLRIIRDHVATAERHVTRSDQHIARQIEIIDELDRDGQPIFPPTRDPNRLTRWTSFVMFNRRESRDHDFRNRRRVSRCTGVKLLIRGSVIFSGCSPLRTTNWSSLS